MLKNYKYYLENLECANCALKIENEIKKNNKFQDVSVNFNTLTLTFKYNGDNPFLEVARIIKTIEPDTKAYTEKPNTELHNYELIRLIIASILIIISLFISNSYLKNIIIIISYLLLLYKTFLRALKKIINSHKIDENLLICISAVGAYILGEHMEGLMVVILYDIGKILEDKALNHSRKSISDLLSLKVNNAYLKNGQDIIEVKAEYLKVGDIIVVKKGDIIPVDGIIIEGNTFLDISSLTGEANLEKAIINDKVLSGSINTGELILIKVTHTYIDSTAYKILELTMNATNNKAKVETKVSKIASFYTPIVLIIAILIGIFLPIFTNINYHDAIYRALTFLVISCPCAIAISVPLSYFAGIGVCSKNKILVKGSNYLDEILKCKKIIFDKTGTLTTGSFHIKDIIIYQDSYKKEDILDIIKSGEKYSNHPIAKLILNDVVSKNEYKITDFKEISGKGISYKIKDKEIKVGSSSFCKTKKKANIFLAINDEVIAGLIFDDTIKDNATYVINELKRRNIDVLMLTGDNEYTAKIVANKLNIDYKCNLLPNQKYQELERLQKDNHVIFVGDGINDAPSLIKANVGISMGFIGSNSAIEASDIVLMNDNLSLLTILLDIARKTSKIITCNLILAIGIKLIILVFATLGYATMWAAVFADTGVTLLTILNSLRILNIKKN